MGYRLRDLGCTRTCRGSGGVGLVGLGMFFSFFSSTSSKEIRTHAVANGEVS